jgi:hypothetical protein
MRGRSSDCTSQGKGSAETEIDPWEEILISKTRKANCSPIILIHSVDDNAKKCESFL